MTPKNEIEAALAKAIHAVIVEHVVKNYMANTENPTSDDAPLLSAKVRAIYLRHERP